MEERKMILKMIEDGKITAEEGIRLLEAMEQKGTERLGETSSKNEAKGQFLSTDVNWDAGEEYRERHRQTQQSSSSNKLADFFDTAIQKIKDIDLDFNFGSSTVIDHVFQHRDVSPHSLDISLENGTVDVRPWDEPDVRVECEAKIYRVRDTDEARKVLLQETTFLVDDNKLLFHTKVKTMKVKAIVYVPKTLFEHVKFYTFNGQITGEKISTTSFEANTLNGPIQFSNLKAKKVNAETVNGAIELRSSSAELIDAKTVNGTITIDGKYHDADLETVNGTITYNLDPFSDPSYLDVKAATGSIHLSFPDDVRVEAKLKTNVGGYSVHLPEYEVIEEKKDFAQKNISFVANQDATPRLKVYAITNTGSINVKERE
ncbi:hypothetical protein AJ85_17320 [Alkalihalobacillus alcalophilus ATCC 27647 = CGMCC 1.3604]|uniref:Uncharacterized protein n=1 Tax=Alkalihalobacillus alcalophilus ATCC 27647 = CGMCC 1.3604 TaxID=1218173 RepID=A0A094WIC9_ALKAL|nr:DUF4097 domain-containing protein [Alkalihalobacillus alcalophilus]KGA95658.1 hypothetical protein BALCAV_0221085 [Alkalihalobacillus alcalophilus ATCC 27647 = CGMCC 1.3604]MED1564073.1 DUF4097 domain-containing protein [Alkalihalobacillus alcalophilus]THG89504.1 hypothetical protein AJ85_17320 [Alkalihalobacillus alcalophilus ATCC 27647 = CGMCC 1.3604]